jgi:hypothetical protein
MGALTQRSGALTGDATLTVNGLFTWTGGRQSGDGLTQANGGLASGSSVVNLSRLVEVRLRAFLQDEVWPQIPEALRGRRLTKAEEEAILGYGEQGI